MNPTDNQDELMHELIRGSTEYIAPEFDEAENDGTQFLNLHYHVDEEQGTDGEEEECPARRVVQTIDPSVDSAA